MDKSYILQMLELARETSKDDPEQGHKVADDALLALINDDEIEKAFIRVIKWYA